MSNPGLTVYFRGFPEEIAKEELEAIFSEYGTIEKLFVHKNGTYGMVEYDNLSSCTSAISSLNNKPPLNMYCNMAKVNSARNNSSMNSNENRTPTVRFNYPNIDSVQINYETLYVDANNTVINFLTDPQTNEIFVPIRYAQNIRKITRAVPVVPEGSFYGNGNMNDMDDAVSVVSASSNRSRRVNYDNVSHNIKIERSFNDDDSASNYSRRSQKPAYGNRFPRDNSQDGFSNKKDDQKTNNRRFNNTNTDEAKPRYFKKGPGSSGDNKNLNNHHKYPKKDFHKSKSPENGEADWGSNNADNGTPTPSTSRAPITAAQSSSAARRPNPFHNKPKPKTLIYYKSVELPKNQYTQVQIEHAVSESVGWAQISDKEDEFNAFMLRVIKKSVDDPRPTKPEVGKICLAKYEGVMFRAVVLTVFPKLTVRFIDYGNESEVEDEILEMDQDDLKVPAYAFHIQLADGAPCKVRNGATMKVKPVKYESETVIVHVENGIYDREPEPPVLAQRAPVSRASAATTPEVPEPCNSTAVTPTASSTSLIKTSLTSCQETMISKLIVGMSGTMEVTIKLSSTKSVAFFLPDALGEDVALLEEIASAVEDIDTSYKPKLGDLVAAQNEGWNRAVILKIENGYKVAFIDYGIVKTVKEVRALPNNYKSVAQFSCVVQASAADFEKIDKIKQQLFFKIKNIVNNIIHCILSNDQGTNFYEATLSLWTPEDTSKPPSRMMAKFSSSSSLDTVKQAPLTPPELKLKNGDDVKIIDQNNGFLFVRTKEGFDILKRVDKYIAEYAPKADNIKEKPVVGQYVASQFENVWYRAQVKQVKQNSAEILYIDYGNEEIKPFFSLKHLDDNISKEPCSLIKIKLKGFIDKPFTKKCLDALASLVANNQPLKASFQGSCENGVDLTMKDGTNLSEKLMKLDVVALPRPNPFHPRKEFYMTVKVPGPNDERLLGIKLEPIPFGKGAVIYLSDVDLACSAICVCVSKPDILHKVHVELLDQMTKYVTHIAPKHPHRPILEEAVLVENRDKWYRAICLEPLEDNFTVFFVDYGFNMTVTADKIRAMPPEFVSEYKALGNFAVIHGLPDILDAKLIDRIESLLVKYDTYEVEVLQKDAEENYTIHFPEILRTLRSENLI